MPKCTIKKGFFVLRDCGQTAMKLCMSCNRPACQQHAIERENNQIICVDCHARQNEADTDFTAESTRYNRAWSHRYRHHHYSHHHYTPYYSGTYFDHYYDDYDVRAFDRELAEPAATLDDSDEQGFFDS